MGYFSDRRVERAKAFNEYMHDIAEAGGRSMEERQHEFDERLRKRELERHRERLIAQEVMGRSLAPASKENYEQWLSAWLAAGRVATHRYNYPFEQSNHSNAFKLHGKGWYLAVKDFETVPLYGSSSVSIIVPQGVEHVSGDLGHTNLYMFKSPNPEQEGPFATRFVPVYSDLSIRL